MVIERGLVLSAALGDWAKAAGTRVEVPVAATPLARLAPSANPRRETWQWVGAAPQLSGACDCGVVFSPALLIARASPCGPGRRYLRAGPRSSGYDPETLGRLCCVDSIPDLWLCSSACALRSLVLLHLELSFAALPSYGLGWSRQGSLSQIAPDHPHCQAKPRNHPGSDRQGSVLVRTGRPPRSDAQWSTIPRKATSTRSILAPGEKRSRPQALAPSDV